MTAGAIRSNHVRQTAAIAARFGLGCVAMLENPTRTGDPDYLTRGNRMLCDLFGTQTEAVDNLDHADGQLQSVVARLHNAGKRPYVIPIGGSNALGALGYVRAGLELARQIRDRGLAFSAVVLASSSAGTHGGPR